MVVMVVRLMVLVIVMVVAVMVILVGIIIVVMMMNGNDGEVVRVMRVSLSHLFQIKIEIKILWSIILYEKLVFFSPSSLCVSINHTFLKINK